MLTFLRKIRKTIVNGGSSTRYITYAIGEILLVMVGILLALQVNNWNQNRLDSIEEQQILKSIFRENNRLGFYLRNGNKRQENTMAAAEKLLMAINDPPNSIVVDSLDQRIYQLNRRWMTGSGFETNIYDVLIGGGQIELLSSNDLRNALAASKAQMGTLNVYEDIQAKFVDERMMPFLDEYVDRLSISADGLELNSLLGQSRFRSSYTELLASRDFSNLLVGLMKHTRGILGVYSRMDRNMNLIRSLLEEEISSPTQKPDSSEEAN